MQNANSIITTAHHQDTQLLRKIIQSANLPIAKQNQITPNSDPKHPAFIDGERLQKEMQDYQFLLYDDIACVAYRIKQEAMYVNRLAVIPAMQGRSIGLTLMQHLVDLAKNQQCHYLSIGINGNAQALKKWYENMGFSVYEEKHFSHISFPVYMLRLYVNTTE